MHIYQPHLFMRGLVMVGVSLVMLVGHIVERTKPTSHARQLPVHVALLFMIEGMMWCVQALDLPGHDTLRTEIIAGMLLSAAAAVFIHLCRVYVVRKRQEADGRGPRHLVRGRD